MSIATPNTSHHHRSRRESSNCLTFPWADVKALWKELFQTDTPTHNRQFLERRIADRLQEVEFRKVDRALMDRNKRRIQQIIDSGKSKQPDRKTSLMPGTVMTREYQGHEYRVMATADGQFEYDGRLYASLSRIAREITGTAWSGPMFFGLKTRAGKSSPKKQGVRK